MTPGDKIIEEVARRNNAKIATQNVKDFLDDIVLDTRKRKP